MAITRTQIAKQLLSKGGRIGLMGGGKDHGGDRGPETGRGPGPVGGDGNRERQRTEQYNVPTVSVDDTTNRERGIMNQYKGPGSVFGEDKRLGYQGDRFKNVSPKTLEKLKNYGNLMQKTVNPLGFLTRLPGLYGDVFSSLTPNPFGYSRTPEEEDDDDTGGGEGIQDPCKGPNPPAYCFTGLRSAEAATPEVEEDDEIINYRLMNKGGRVNLFKGAQADASAGKGAMSPGTSGLGGSQAGGYGRDQENRGDRTKDDPRDVEKNKPTFFNNPIDFVKTKLNTFAGLTPVDLAMAKNIETDDDDDDEKSLQQTLAGGITNIDKVMSRQDEIEAAAKALGYNMGGRAGLAGGGMPYEGGIMDLESSRQMYGLGKLVKKVTRSVKKIAKSPIGKAALLYAGGTYLGGLNAFGGSGTFMSNLKSGQGIGNLFNFGKNKLFGELITGGNAAKGAGYMKKGLLSNKALLGIGVPTALSYFMTPEEEEEQKLYAGADIDDVNTIINNPRDYINPRLMAEGGSTEEKEPVAKKVMPLLDMEGQEKDYRETGGFVDMGRMEKADDVPARLSKNEFVFTADAVRNAGDGSVDKGAEVMYNMMKNLESGGDVSEESQGLEGARDMFKTSQRLEEVL